MLYFHYTPLKAKLDAHNGQRTINFTVVPKDIGVRQTYKKNGELIQRVSFCNSSHWTRDYKLYNEAKKNMDIKHTYNKNRRLFQGAGLP